MGRIGPQRVPRQLSLCFVGRHSGGCAPGGRERVPSKVYIRAAKFRSHAFDGFLKELQADKGWKTVRLDCGHEAMVDAPELLADTLETVA